MDNFDVFQGKGLLQTFWLIEEHRGTKQPKDHPKDEKK